jgi:hypothetical protein
MSENPPEGRDERLRAAGELRQEAARLREQAARLREQAAEADRAAGRIESEPPRPLGRLRRLGGLLRRRSS